ncbi:hypothetical protein [Micromonospora lutea]|uniref:Uncharacterized protein n=1 Tax=Micromonospora lutea TaxID=419825 RepID=A0ABQ4IX40_9ACTN|nr:hypothetical protein [Micromonospora lutea]GIJ22494.1 hypothetical protein Vlu01_31180 [Micromonospora lutea]
MLAVAPTRPLWWLARWAARLLTGLVVAAAFTLGAWALPGEAGPADRLAAAAPTSLVQAASPPATADWKPAGSSDLAALLGQGTGLDLAASVDAAGPDLVGSATPTVRDAGDPAADPGGASAAQPVTSAARSGLAALGSVAADVTPGPSAGISDVRVARAPPHA